MAGFHEHQNFPQQVLVEDKVLDVIGMMLDAEGQELEDDTQELRIVIGIYLYLVLLCVL